MIVVHSTSEESLGRILTEGIRPKSETDVVGQGYLEKSSIICLTFCNSLEDVYGFWGSCHFSISPDFIRENRDYFFAHEDTATPEFRRFVKENDLRDFKGYHPKTRNQILSTKSIPPSALTNLASIYNFGEKFVASLKSLCPTIKINQIVSERGKETYLREL